jgi:hypothetical protein
MRFDGAGSAGLVIAQRVTRSIRIEERAIDREGCLHTFGRSRDDQLHAAAGIPRDVDARDVLGHETADVWRRLTYPASSGCLRRVFESADYSGADRTTKRSAHFTDSLLVFVAVWRGRIQRRKRLTSAVRIRQKETTERAAVDGFFSTHV